MAFSLREYLTAPTLDKADIIGIKDNFVNKRTFDRKEDIL
jgi:hypothetical protein|tara:strand:- start:1891 stop:2010 length:120 start_codon:yes stop_codon:yes gene_type:complete